MQSERFTDELWVADIRAGKYLTQDAVRKSSCNDIYVSQDPQTKLFTIRLNDIFNRQSQLSETLAMYMAGLLYYQLKIVKKVSVDIHTPNIKIKNNIKKIFRMVLKEKTFIKGH